MPGPGYSPDAFDPQDQAETYDETHRADDLNPDEATDLDEDVYDATSALGDADEDEMDEDEDEDDDLIEGDEEDDEDDDADDGAPDETDLTDDPLQAKQSRGGASEADLRYVKDVDAVDDGRDRQARRYESSGELSDRQVADLGYGRQASPQDKASKTPPPEKPDTKADADARLEEGLEETFPASDPVSAKHIS